MKKGYIILLAIFAPIVVITFLNFISFDLSEHYEQGVFTENIQEGIEKKTVIGVYEYYDIDIAIERIEEQDPYKYIYFSPTTYSNDFFINPYYIINSDIAYILLNNEDTIYGPNGINPFNVVPDRLFIINNNDEYFSAERTAYFKENILTPPKPSLKEQFTWGPFFE